MFWQSGIYMVFGHLTAEALNSIIMEGIFENYYGKK